jgi:hypothetical protein
MLLTRTSISSVTLALALTLSLTSQLGVSSSGISGSSVTTRYGSSVVCVSSSQALKTSVR